MKNFTKLFLFLVFTCSVLCRFNLALAEDKPSFASRIPFKKNQLNADEKIRVMLHISKSSIYPQFNQPAVFLQSTNAPAGSGGAGVAAAIIVDIVGVLIANHLSEADRDEAVKFNHQIETAIASIDINSEFKASLQNELSKLEQFKKTEFESVEHLNELSQAGLIARIEEPTILTLATRIHFDEELKTLCFSTNAKVWRKNEVVPIYLGDLNYLSAYLHGANTEDLKKKWAADNGRLLKDKISEGVAEVTRLLVQELSADDTKPADITTQMFVETLNPNTNKKIQAPLYILEDMPDRLIGRLGAPDSSLVASIPKVNVTLKSPK